MNGFILLVPFLRIYITFNLYLSLILQSNESTDGTAERKIINALQDFMEITTRDFMKDGQG